MRSIPDDPCAAHEESFGSWRCDGSAVIRNNFRTFCYIVAQAKIFVLQNRYDMAAIYADLAAEYAFSHHCGLFSSPELERILVDIGQKTVPSRRPGRARNGTTASQRILHVATGLTAIGGITAFICRWVRQDAERSHSFVITRQLREKVPDAITEAVVSNGGSIYRLNTRPGGIISWARRLREIASTVDVVVLHTSTHDVVPILAFASKDDCPPIIYVNHADHVLSLGVSISDVFANLRGSGMELSQKRRGVAPERNALLPTLIADNRRTHRRVEAKRQLGLHDDSVVLLSVARKVKFNTLNGISYADAHLPVLAKHKNAVLITVVVLPPFQRTLRRLRFELR